MKYNTVSLIVTIFCLISIWWLKTPFFGLPVFLLYLGFTSHTIGGQINSQWRNEWRIFFGLIFYLCSSIIILTGIYWIYEVNAVVISIYIVLSYLLLFLFKLINIIKRSKIKDQRSLPNRQSMIFDLRSSIFKNILIISFLLSDLILFLTLLSRRYGDTLTSPWTIIGPKFFLLFLVASALLIWLTQKIKSSKINLTLLSIHYLLIFGVALIIFKHGFGFDQFIHEATEKFIINNGSILPKQPYYLGQYLLAIFVHFTTSLPVGLIDKIIVPISTAFLLPSFVYYCLVHTENNRFIFPALAILPIFPLSFFTFTTPFNFALFLALLIFFWIWYEEKNGNWKTTIFGLVLTLASICIHPFVGIPVLIIYGGSLFYKKNIHFIISILYSLILISIIPLILYFISAQSSADFYLQNPFNNLNYFIRIFDKPYWYWFTDASLIWQIFYLYRLLLIPLIVVAVIIQISQTIWQKTTRLFNKLTVFLSISTISLIFSSFIVATTLRLPNVISYEQSDYARRLLIIALLLNLPFFLIILQKLFAWLWTKKTIFIISFTFGLALLLTVSFYFTYPTRDPISRYTGFAVRDADIEAIKFIDDRNDHQKNYLVLTNQVVSAAAIKEFGFSKYFSTTAGEQYFYSIPTGGPFYQYFRQMVYVSASRQWMEAAMKFASVEKAYFIHTNYWAPAAQIRDQAKLEADNWWELAGGRIWVYEYLQKK